MDLIQAGHRLGVLARSKRVHLALHHAAWQQGFIVVPLPPDAPGPQTARMLDAAHVDVVVTDPSCAATAESAHGQRPVLVCDEDGEPTGHVDGHLDAPERGSGTFAAVRTSGTSGEASWIDVPRRAMEAHREAAMGRLGCRQDSVWLHALPMHHMGGIGIVDRCLHGGGRLVLQDRFDADGALDAMRAHGVTHVSLVPTMLRRLLAAERSRPEALECVLVGGDRLPPDLERRALEDGWPIYASYGLTETCGQVTTARPEELKAVPGTVGSPLEGLDVRITDGEHDLSAGKTGEIVVEGTTVCTPGPLRTGDLGHLDDVGRLFVSGRRDDRITTGGKKVDPARVEAVLEADPAVHAACVVGVADEEWGARVVALVEADGPIDVDELRARCRQGLEPHEVPRSIRVGPLPRTETGKVRRAAVRDDWGR